MKDLLNAIKSQLQNELTYVRDSDVFVAEDENLISGQVKFPAIGLKDGSVAWSITSQGPLKTQTLSVRVIAYVSILRPEASIMGDNQQKGVLDIIDDIRAALDENTLNGTVNNAEVVSEAESELIGDEEDAIQKKSITFRYERW